MDFDQREALKLPHRTELGAHTKDGATAVVLVVTPSHIAFANVGDARGFLVRDGKVCT